MKFLIKPVGIKKILTMGICLGKGCTCDAFSIWPF